MNSQVFWTFGFAINEGQFEDFKILMEEMIAATEINEPGTICYEWTISNDNTQCHIHERYIDSYAAISHLKTFVDKYADRLMGLGKATHFIVYGNPNSEAKAMLDGFGAVYLSSIGGFHR